MKRNIIYLTCLVLASGLLLMTYPFFDLNSQKNGFTRKIKAQDFELERIFELPSPAFYFAGHSQTEMYFKDLKNLSQLFTIDYKLSGLKTIDLKLRPDSQNTILRVNIGVQDTTIYITDNQSGALTLINNTTGISSYFQKPDVRLDNSGLLTGQSIFGRSTVLKNDSLSRQLVKLNYLNASMIKTYPLKKQVDGYFCTDGFLKFDTVHSRLYYMYVYRGEFLCLDTNLNLLYKSKTIDTIHRAAVELKQTRKNGKLLSVTTSKPPKPINRNFVLFNGSLYNLSAIKSDNESQSEFKNNQVIDVYTTGSYQYSFHIPKYKNIKLREFYIQDDKLYAIFGPYLVQFKMKHKLAVDK